MYLQNPANSAAAVIPSDTQNLRQKTAALYIGGAGDVSCVLSGGSSVVFSNCIEGSVLPIRVARINSSGTTATNIVALFN